MRYIILVSGFSCSGKDVLSDYIVKNCSNFIKLSFAEELKKYVSRRYNFDYSLTNTEKKRIVYNNKTVRDLLIIHGTEERRKDQNVWAIKLTEKIIFMDRLKELRGMNEPVNNFIISDFRFPNEKEYIESKFKESTIITVRINRFDTSNIKSETEEQLNKYNFDYIIENKQDINVFYNNIKTTLDFLFF